MTMNPRHAARFTLLVSLLLMVAVPPAFAASKAPKITKISPMRVKVGSKITIRGKNFSSKRTHNTVFFRGAGGTSAFVKPSRASSKKLVVKVPKSVGKLLKRKSGKAQSTRIKIRVLTTRHFSKYTSSRLSPVVTGTGVPSTGTTTPRAPGGGSGGGSGLNNPSGPAVTPSSCNLSNPSADADGDLLTNSFEGTIGTNPCKYDTDGDGVADGYEYQSALDLGHYPGTAPTPYPGKRPYPNPLDPNDAGTDYDGDGLTLGEEYLMWFDYSADGVRRSGRPTTLNNLLYSDGLQSSENPRPAAPSDPLANWDAELRPDGALDDDERDADGDGLGNWDETHGRFTEAWWVAQHDGNNEPKESPYPGIDYLDQANVGDAEVDPDIDGDGIKDGLDDFDHDGLSNAFELRRPSDWEAQMNSTNQWAYVNPFNPCKPFASARCSQHPPFGYYSGDGEPPIGPAPPSGYPDSHPDTPNG
jgi:hypothetical protein